MTGQKQPLEVFYKKAVLKNFTKFTVKHLYGSPNLDKVTGLRPATLLKKKLRQSVKLSCFSRGIFRTLSNVYDGAKNRDYFRIDVWRSHKYASFGISCENHFKSHKRGIFGTFTNF